MTWFSGNYIFINCIIINYLIRLIFKLIHSVFHGIKYFNRIYFIEYA